MMKIRLPSIRRRLYKLVPTADGHGTKTTEIGYEDCNLVAWIDTDALAKRMGHKAAENKYGHSKIAHGAIAVRVESRKRVFKEGYEAFSY